MRLEELKATQIIKFAMGERGALKCEEELAVILKGRFTKKERFALNAKVSGCDLAEVLEKLNVDEKRYEEIIAGAIKKMKNEGVHGEFYMTKAKKEIKENAD